MKIAIIGSGISGLTAAYLLNRQHDISVFEASDWVGGHTHTVDVQVDGRHFAIDTGFIVFNDWTYPNFIELLNQLGVTYQPTEMSFSVCDPVSGVEYNGNTLNSLLAQRRNLLSPPFWGMLRDILRFNREAVDDLQHQRIASDLSLGSYLQQRGYGTLYPALHRADGRGDLVDVAGRHAEFPPAVLPAFLQEPRPALRHRPSPVAGDQGRLQQLRGTAKRLVCRTHPPAMPGTAGRARRQGRYRAQQRRQ